MRIIGRIKRIMGSLKRISPDDFRYNEEEVLELLLSIDTTKANGPDEISGSMFKATANAIFPSVTVLFNKSIRSGIVPTK